MYLKNFSNDANDRATKKEWDDYYARISVAVPDDTHFIRLIKNQSKVEKIINKNIHIIIIINMELFMNLK